MNKQTELAGRYVFLEKHKIASSSYSHDYERAETPLGKN
jgi:hypothetical protein